MSSKDWDKVKLNEIIESVSIKHKFDKSEIILINTSDVLEGKVLNHGYVENKNLKGQFKKSFQKNDILYSEIRPKNKRFAYVDFNAEDYVASTKLMVLRKKSEMINTRYLYYLLTNDRFITHLQNLAETRSGTFPQITFSELGSYIISLPTLKEQEIIANILSTLDEKIEVNNKINEMLENMVQALFKQWFIDFEFPNENGEPYKSSGGELVESELGSIPKGWVVGSFEDLGKIVSGGTPSKKKDEYFTANGISWITPKDLSNNKNKYIKSGSTDITEAGLKNSSANLMPKGSVLFSSRAPIGYIAIASCETSTNQGFKSIVPSSNFSSEYIFQELKNKTELIVSHASGSTFKEISGKGLKSISITIPSKEIVNKFDEIVNPLSEIIKNKEEENEILKDIRDTLLPKLMSGEIRVPLDELEESVT